MAMWIGKRRVEDIGDSNEIKVESSNWFIDNVAVTSSAAKLNVVGSVTATATELNAAAGVTLGTAIASKNVTTDASLNSTGINNLTTTGNAALGNAAGDTFKVHGTAEAGTQAANVASIVTTGSTLTTPYGYVTAAQADNLVAAVNSIIVCLKAHGLMATA